MTDDVEEDHPPVTRPAGFVEPEIYYAGLATVYVVAGALITDPAGRVLLVKPNYLDHWLLPGGTADEGEPPEVTCAREVKEEIGLDLPVGPLLFVGWGPARAPRPRPMLTFIFDGGDLDRPERIRLQEDEVDDHAFLPPDEACRRLGPVGHRLAPALRARETKIPRYLSEA
ncbi:NUDIX hydrolase [Actinoallomurus sp. NBC_01490]|uniref:NUDIX hydrolase n=1 Tax=Actinoallomurus sp. NBC_01490 TaxID=2903557 RepID=UPI002E31D817|nr:NUDIX hydrolase [Actinoallomurus sp. NBC_01490]